MRIVAVALAAFLLAPAAGVAVTEVAMIPVEGEGSISTRVSVHMESGKGTTQPQKERPRDLTA